MILHNVALFVLTSVNTLGHAATTFQLKIKEKNIIKWNIEGKNKILWTKIKNIKKDAWYFDFEMFSVPVKLPFSVI